MGDGTIEGVSFDHVAHAVPRWHDVWTVYAFELGAQWSSGGPGRGFSPAQLCFANGARIEVLMPNETHLNDFLKRFLAATGPGPHHMTFKVPELTTAIDKAKRAGFEPIGIDRSDPEWMEAFLHPKAATGVVVQLAEAYGTWSTPPPADFPRGGRQRADGSGPVPPAAFRRIVHAVADMDSASSLFVGLLGGSVEGRGARSDHEWTEITWGGPLGLRLVAPRADSSATPLHDWLRGRNGRIHHLELDVDEPATISGAEPATGRLVGLAIDDGMGEHWVVGRDANAGLQLVFMTT
jgi:methylmalonyl-CoA/ethylmalonyl-CoA epimerase